MIDARLEWVAQDVLDTFPTPNELTSMVNDYAPNVEVVFMTVDAEHRGAPWCSGRERSLAGNPCILYSGIKVLR